MANAIPVTNEGKKLVPAKKSEVEVIGTLPEGFEVPANAKRIIVDERGQVRVDL